MKCKRIIAAVLALILAASLVLYFAVPVNLLRREDIFYIFVRQGSDSERMDIKSLDLEELEARLRSTPCRRILDATYNFYGDSCAYEIGIQFEGGDFMYVLLGDPDPKGEETMMNKTYDPSKNNMLPNIRHRILEPQALIDYLDSCLAGD